MTDTSLTITGLGALLRGMTFSITVTADDLALVGAVLGAMTLLTTVVASTTTTTTLRAVTREMTNYG